MIEHWLGSDVFRKGVEAYLRAHAWHNATASDLFSALTKASGKDVATLAATFLDRPGVPVVSVAVDCKAKPPTLSLAQAGFRPFGDSAGAAISPWIIPTDMRASGEELRVLFGATSEAYPVPKCPAWVDPNVGGRGYYLYSQGEKAWRALAAVIESQPESSRLEFLQSLAFDVRSGAVGPDLLLRLLPVFDSDPSNVIVGKVIGILTDVERVFITPESRTAFASYAAARLLPHKRALDARLSAAKSSPTEDDVDMRQALFGALGALAHDPATLAEATRLTVAWLADPSSVDGDLALVAVPLASQKAGPDRVDSLVAAMKRAKTPSGKRPALLALAGFVDPATLDKALGVTLTEDVGPGDAAVPLWLATLHPATRVAAKRWMTDHWPALHAKLSTLVQGELFATVGLDCTKAEVDADRAAFTPRVAGIEGSARPLAEALEGAALCSALQEKSRGAIDAFFKVKTR